MSIKGAIFMSMTLGASLGWMGYSVFSSGTATEVKNVERVQFVPKDKSPGMYPNVAKSKKELLEMLSEHEIVYNPTELSYSKVTAPGRCDVFILESNLTKEVYDYEVLRCQRMLFDINVGEVQ